MFDPDQSSRLVRPDLDPTVCTPMVETTRSVASGLSMSHKKETLFMLVNSLPTILVSSADNLCK